MGTKNTLPDHLLEEIQSRLPVRQLLRLRCVSKSWSKLISNYKFINKHHQIHHAMWKDEGDIPLFMDSPSSCGLDDHANFYLLSKKRGDVIVYLTPDLERDSFHNFNDDSELFNTLVCAGVVNGIILLHWVDEHLALWNPATREFKAIPPPRPNPPDSVTEFFGGILGLGFDAKSDNFKIMRSINRSTNKAVNGDFEHNLIYEMYSLKTNSWKSFKEPMPNLYMRYFFTDGHFNGVYYWPAMGFESNLLILSFDFDTEVFNIVDPPPFGVNIEDNWDCRVSKFMDFLALILTRVNYGERVWNFEIWVASRFDVNNHGIPLLWQHLFTIGPICDYDGLWLHTFRMDGEILFNFNCGHDENLIEEEEVGSALYNLTTRTFKKVGPAFGNCYRYVESLFTLLDK